MRHGTTSAAAAHRDRALLLVWPPYGSPMARLAANAWRGEVLVYVGEGPGGCTADDSFHNLMEREFAEVAEVANPCWDGIHDWVQIYRRKS